MKLLFYIMQIIFPFKNKSSLSLTCHVSATGEVKDFECTWMNEGEIFLVPLKFKGFFFFPPHKRRSCKHCVLAEFQMWCTQMRYIPPHSQWHDYILIFTVLVHGIADSGEGAALSLAPSKYWACAPSVVFGQLSSPPVSCVPWVHQDAGAPQLQPLLGLWSCRGISLHSWCGLWAWRGL